MKNLFIAIYKKDTMFFTNKKSLSLHMTNVNSSYGLSPMVDWLDKKLWKKNKY